MRLRAGDAVDPIRGPRRRCRSHRWPRRDEAGGQQPILSVESHGEPVALVTRRRRWIREVVAEGTSNEGGAVYGGGEGGPVTPVGVRVGALGIDLYTTKTTATRAKRMPWTSTLGSLSGDS